MDANDREILINRLRDIGNDTIERQREEGPQREAYHQRSIDALTLAIAALEREHAERWRSVEEELPEPLVRVLVTFYRDNDAEVTAALY